MASKITSSLKIGLTFSILIIFLFLIGFLNTASELLGELIRIDVLQDAGISAEMINMLLFLGILGIWIGILAAQDSEQKTWRIVLQEGIFAGLMVGIVVGATAFLFGSLQDAGVQMIKYLSAMLPRTVDLFRLDLPASTAAIFYLIFFTFTGFLGIAISKGILRRQGRKTFKEYLETLTNRIRQIPFIKKIFGYSTVRYVVYGVLLLMVCLVPLQLGQYWNYTLGTVGIYVLLGLGLNIVVGLAGLLDLGYVAFFAIGAYSVALLTAPAPHNVDMNFWLALIIGIILAALAGIILGIPVLRLRGDYLAIVTLGFGEIIRILSKSDLLSSFTGGPRGVTNIGGPTLFGQPFRSNIHFVYLIILACLLIIFVTRRLQNSRIGRAWIAMREDETVAQAMGINVMRYKLLAFAIGAAFAGLGGVIFAARNQFTGPEDHNLMVSINVLSLIIVGGMGSIPGVIAGAFVLKGLPEVLRELENYRVLAFGALLVAMMILRPEGLIPSTRRRLEMHEEKVPLEEPPDTEQESEE